MKEIILLETNYLHIKSVTVSIFAFFTLKNMYKNPKTHVMMMMVMVIRSYDGDNCGDDCSDAQRS